MLGELSIKSPGFTRIWRPRARSGADAAPPPVAQHGRAGDTPTMSDMFGMFGMFAPRGRRALGASLAPAARLVVCAAVPWYACLWLGTTADPVPAALPAVLILREDVFEAPRLALQRLVGVVAGVLLSVAVLHRLPPGSLSFLIVLVCGCAGMYLLRQGGSPNQQVLITALMIYATAEPGYPLARLEESAVGIAVVALLGPLLWPRTPTGTPRPAWTSTAPDCASAWSGPPPSASAADGRAQAPPPPTPCGTARTNCPPPWSAGRAARCSCRPGGLPPEGRTPSAPACCWPRGRRPPCCSSHGSWRPGRPAPTGREAPGRPRRGGAGPGPAGRRDGEHPGDRPARR
ncbi:FUSC family protein [Streptomyces sp. MS1.HAVA.3]|uniref:FUSC family protein n=1 Tax=Streptomyces caledonius TaxID=3134107 RepID=A0ABU8UF12_9ACTN